MNFLAPIKTVSLTPGILILLLLTVAGRYDVHAVAELQPEPVAIYLTWQRSPHTTMTVHWITDTRPETSKVSYRKDGEPEWSIVSGNSQRIPYLSEWVNTVEITGLESDRIYKFMVNQGNIHRFRTMPARLDRPVRFIAGGDIYHREDWMNTLNALAASKNPEFILIGGDLAYEDAKPELAGRWLVMLKSFYRHFVTDDGLTIPIVVSIGNHEVAGGFNQTPDKAPGFYSLFSFPGLPGYNHLDFGDYLSLFVLDTQHTNPIEGPQTKWLAASMEERRHVNHKFALYHVPAYPSFRDFDYIYSRFVRTHWVPLFEHFGLDFAFENHDHAFKRTYPITANRPANSGVVYLGDGAWGVSTRKLLPGDHRWYLRKHSDDRHFHHVSITGDRRSVRVYNEQGELIDHFSQRVKPVDPWPLRNEPFRLFDFIGQHGLADNGPIMPELTDHSHPELADETLYHSAGPGTVELPFTVSPESGITFSNKHMGDRYTTGVSIALDTRGSGNIQVEWTASMIESGSLEYGLRLQYRTGWTDTFTDILMDEHPVEYLYTRDSESVNYQITLTVELENQPYAELRWKYYYTGTRERNRDRDGDVIRLSDISITSAITTSTISRPPTRQVPAEVTLEQNYPNPFNPVTVIRYAVPEQSRVTLQVFTSGGIKVATLADGTVPAGYHSVSFDARGMASGVYLYRLQTGDTVITKRMILVK
ncbi:MAG: T9SS C-terminal target domain-containing protein [Balneolaceae bacterium]|nr:MAG: T9SS C-terminal target domain-containing protein [Balneolaceae bacterium]